jgi:hypothetical protein
MPEDVEFIRRRNGEIEPLVRKRAILPQTSVKPQQFGALGARRRCPLLLENLMDQGRIFQSRSNAKKNLLRGLSNGTSNMQRLANIDSRLALQVTSRIRPLSQLTLHEVSFGAQAPSKTPYSVQVVSHEPTRCSNVPRPITTSFISHATT